MCSSSFEVSCALTWRLTKDATAAATGLVLFNALLDDYTSVGDGAGGDGAVQHDSGYDIRIFAPYAALGSFMAENNRIPDLAWSRTKEFLTKNMK